MKLLFKNFCNKILYDKTAKAWERIKAYYVPTAFAVLFYAVSFLLGNRSICIFKATYGMPCPACGMTRAFICIFKGHIKEAFFYHPLFLFPIIILLVLLFRRKPKISVIYKNNFFWITVFVIFMVVWVIRMIFLFPYSPPLDFSRFGLIPVIFRTITNMVSSTL